MRKPGPTLIRTRRTSRPALAGDHWMAVTGHPLTAEVAAWVLRAGGNAVDAGVAAGIASNVVQVDMCNLGGIAPMLVKPASSSEVTSIAGVGPWSQSATVESYVQRHGETMPAGCAGSVVPGALGAWLTALERFGTWSFSEVAQPAIELAVEGFVLDPVTASCLDMFAWVFERWPSSAAVYCPQGNRLAPGDRLVQSDLGRLLDRLATAESRQRSSAPVGGRAADAERRGEGLDAARREFYEGESARAMAEFVCAQGGFMTERDLAFFAAEVDVAPAQRFGGFDGLTFHVPPARWSQGPALLEALAILEHFDLERLGHNSPRYVHVVLESIKLAFADREHHYGDAHPPDVDDLMDADRVAMMSEMIKADTVLEDLIRIGHPADRTASTTEVVVVDSEGGVFACTPSDTLAMAPIVPGLGVMVSPRGVQSRIDPSHPAVLGPGLRPRVTPAPVIAVSDDGLMWPIVCPGGDVILQAILQSFLDVSVFGMSEQEAVEAPRFASLAFPNSFHPHEHRRGAVVLENRFGDEVFGALEGQGHQVLEWPAFEFEAGSVAMIRQTPPADGASRPTLRAGVDPRRSAYAIGR